MNKYMAIIISVASSLIFLSAIGSFDNVLWHYIDAIITIGTMIGVWYSYQQNQKQLEIINIFLVINAKSKQIPTHILRKNFSRAEIKGILRELAQEREYQIDYISNPKSSFLKDISEIQQAKKNSLEIRIEQNDKFTLKDMF